MWQKQRNLKKRNFFKILNTNANAKRNLETFKLLSKSDNYKLPSGNKIKINPFYDKKDYADNLSRGILMTDKLNLKVEIRPDVKDWRNPEYRINGLIADLYRGDVVIGLKEKRKQIKEFISKFNARFSKTPIPKDYAIVFDITNVKIDYDIARVINGRFKSGNKMNFIVIINDNKIIKIDRKDSFDLIVTKVESLNAKEK